MSLPERKITVQFGRYHTDQRECWVDDSLKFKDDLGDLVGCRCACCTKCRFYVNGKRAATCCHGGPYTGYIKMIDIFPEK